MAVDKKFFVDINLQGNALNNATIGSNSDMTKAGSFRFNGTTLEYYNGTAIEEVANLSDIAAVTGGLILQGGYDAATNTPDIAGGSASKGFFWVVTEAGSFLGESVQVGDSIIAKVDNAGASIGDWLILQGNVVIATDTVDGIVRLATQAEVDAGTEGGAVVLTPATFEGSTQLSDIRQDITDLQNDKLARDGSQAMTGNLNMGTLDIENVGNIYANSVSGTGSSAVSLTYGASANNNKITSVSTPTNGTDATNKNYVDDAALTAENNAKSYANSLAPNYDPAGSAAAAQTAAEAYTDSLAPNYDPAGSAATAQSNAESFATSAANTAESNANSYTDTQIAAQTFSQTYADTDWAFSGAPTNVYYLNVMHFLGTNSPKVACFVNDLVLGGTELVEFNVNVADPSFCTLYSNIAPPASVLVGVSK